MEVCISTDFIDRIHAKQMWLDDHWTMINSVYDLPISEEYKTSFWDEDITWDDIFKQEKEIGRIVSLYSDYALFILMDNEERCFPAIGRVEFYGEVDFSEVPNNAASYCFNGVAIAPTDFVGDHGSYLTGNIYATPIAWMPFHMKSGRKLFD